MRVATKFTHADRGTSYYIWEIYDENDLCVAISANYFTSHYSAEVDAQNFIDKVKGMNQ